LTDADPDILAFLEALRPVRVGKETGYSRLDRYRDFRATFGTDAGRRVLRQIMDLCEGPPAIETDLTNHALLAARAWSRRNGQMIVAWATVPPPEDPTAQPAP
jgi:hypothetical protein